MRELKSDKLLKEKSYIKQLNDIYKFYIVMIANGKYILID